MKIQPKAAFYTLGCKLNFSETSSLGRSLEEHGFLKVDFDQPADVYVINTCSVTDNADKECKKIVRKAMDNNPGAFVVVTGCYAQLKPAEIASIPGVDLVLGAKEKFNVAAYLDSLEKKNAAEVHSCEIDAVNRFIPSHSGGDRTRSFLKVQDGCDYTCSYCTIPLARGASRSGSIADIVKQAESLAAGGTKEIVLTGVNIGDFGTEKHTFLDLIKALDEVDGIERFRISSIEPNLLKDEIIEFVAQSKRFAPHFHIPLQSGSNRILKLMRRRYLRELYSERVNKIKAVMPHACIGVDVIAGFPSETEEDFMETWNYLHGLDISYLHVFTYSERADTDAAMMKEPIPYAERKRRNALLRNLSEKKQVAFAEAQKGKVLDVLWEKEKDNEWMYGFSGNYVKLKTHFRETKVNSIEQITLPLPGVYVS